MQWWRIRFYITIVCADYPAAQALLPFMESPAAHRCCRGCDFNQSSPLANKPCSFTSKGQWTLWTWKELQSALDRLSSLSAAQFKEEARQYGINKLVYACHPDNIPGGINPTTLIPQDLMHLLLDGITRQELAWLIYVLVSRKLLDWDRLVAACKKYPWPPGVRIPPLAEKLKSGKAGNLPRPGATLGMSASQTMDFAVHRSLSNRCYLLPSTAHALPHLSRSIALIKPLLFEGASEHPAWKSWVAHHKVLCIALQHELSMDDVAELDDAVLEYKKRFAQVTHGPVVHHKACP